MYFKRKKFGILFNYSSKWMGGIIYIINVVRIFNFLEDEEKPEIFLFYKPDLYGFIKDFNYPYLHLIEWSFPSIVKGNILSLLVRRNLFVDKILLNYSLDVIFPLPDFPVKTNNSVKLVAWWADLQEKYYPEFFTKMQIAGRDIRAKLIIRNSRDLVVSSQNVLDDFRKFYKLKENLNTHIFHFVSVIDGMDQFNFDSIKLKYGLPDKYFLVSNQFHKHKNHRVILLSIAILKKMGIVKHVAFTGKFPAAKNSPYLAELHDIIEKNSLHNQVTMLGIISRNDQLQLMRYSQAVLQPSLFEGWSTVIEDAKSLQVPVVASNILVNIEQLGENGIYFDPHDPQALALILADYPERNLNDVFYEDYNARVRNAAKTLLTIFNK